MSNEYKKCPPAHRKICETTSKMCGMAELYVNGNTPCRERIAKPEALQHLPQSNYNDTLAEMAEDTRQRDIERLESIRLIDAALPTLARKKAILSMMLTDMTQRDISEILHMTQQRVSAISRAAVGTIK